MNLLLSIRCIQLTLSHATPTFLPPVLSRRTLELLTCAQRFGSFCCFVISRMQLLFNIDLSSNLTQDWWVKSQPRIFIVRIWESSWTLYHVSSTKVYVSSHPLAKMPIENQKKPRLLSLMPFKAIEEAYLNDFKSNFILDVRLNLSCKTLRFH